MQKFTLFILAFSSLMFACTTTKKVQTIQTAITKKDTTVVVTVKETPKVDSAAIVKDILNKVQQQKVGFSTFYAKIKIDYENVQESKNFTAYVYMKKDSFIHIRLVGSFLGITKEGVVAKITRDSVTVVNKIDKTVQHRTLAYLQEVTKIPFDFNTLQDLFVGNPIFLNENIVAYRDGEEQFSVLMIGEMFKNLISLGKSDFRVLRTKLDDIDAMKNRTCDITYDNYENKMGTLFSTNRKVSVAEKTKLDITLDFKQYTFNEPLTYMFNIPKNYKKQ
jgi:hypothetical protein